MLPLPAHDYAQCAFYAMRGNIERDARSERDRYGALLRHTSITPLRCHVAAPARALRYVAYVFIRRAMLDAEVDTAMARAAAALPDCRQPLC